MKKAGVKIKGMGMPSRCYACRLATVSCNTPYCIVKIRIIDLSRDDRPDWCPLVEVKDDK